MVASSKRNILFAVALILLSQTVVFIRQTNLQLKADCSPIDDTDLPTVDSVDSIEGTTAPSSSPTPNRYPRIAIGIISGFDWGEQEPFVSFRRRRQIHRDTWMQHPAVNTPNGPIRAYFVIGNQPHFSQGYWGDKKPTHKIQELEPEMNHYGDILLLDTPDMHNWGKMNAWYEWAANNTLQEFDYHIKLDDETYVEVDQLLKKLTRAPRQKFFGGTGMKISWSPNDSSKKNGNITEFLWLRGWGYILSNDLMVGLGQCSMQGILEPNNQGQHEDVYTGLALSICGLDEGVKYVNDMKAEALLFILSMGCPRKLVNGAMFIHGGGGYPTAFRTVSEQTFSILHSVYHAHPIDPTPKWAKMESLRHLYLDVIGVCATPSMQGDWLCAQGWESRTCIPPKWNKRGRAVV